MNKVQKPHLLIIAHGSRSQKWVDSIETFTNSVRDVNLTNDSLFSGVSCCYLEHTNPTIPDALQQLTQIHHTVISIPFFLAPGVHVQQDVPELVSSVGETLRNDERMLQVQNEGSTVYLIPHFAADELLAQNVFHRLQMLNQTIEESALILVYYGSKRYPQIWDNLTESVEKHIHIQYPNLNIKSVYAGDTVDFSPQQTADAIAELSHQKKQVIIFPMVLGVGVIQTEVIPKAVEQSRKTEHVIFMMDSVLPDERLADEIWDYAFKFYQSL
jgi:sirohydrochlorin ferrochelatase